LNIYFLFCNASWKMSINVGTTFSSVHNLT
jgi:hypothetical protein